MNDSTNEGPSIDTELTCIIIAVCRRFTRGVAWREKKKQFQHFFPRGFCACQRQDLYHMTHLWPTHKKAKSNNFMQLKLELLVIFSYRIPVVVAWETICGPIVATFALLWLLRMVEGQ